MNKMLLPALALTLMFGAAHAQDRYGPPPPQGGDDNTHYGWADVLRVDPNYSIVRTEAPQQQCYDQQVVRREGGNTTAGTVLGAIVGGVLGNTIGKGDGRKAATVAGAVAGGAIGHRAAGSGSEYETTETRCREVSQVSEQRRITSYDVEYRYRGEVYVSRLSYDPGERLRVRVSVEPAD